MKKKKKKKARAPHAPPVTVCSMGLKNVCLMREWLRKVLGSPSCSRSGSVQGHEGSGQGLESGRERSSWGSLGALTLAAALVRGQLVPGVTAALVAAQGVEASLLTAPAVGPRALVHLCRLEGEGISAFQARAWVLPLAFCLRVKPRVPQASCDLPWPHARAGSQLWATWL